MAVNSMPAIDVASCSGWTENQITLYNSLPYYLAKMSVERRKIWPTYSKYTKKRKWTPNQSAIIRGVRVDQSPTIRQFTNPNILCDPAKKDVVAVREVTNDAQLYRQKFESPVLNFCPEFTDFLSHVTDFGNNIMRQIEIWEDMFIRTNIWQMAPYVIVANGLSATLVPAPAWSGTGNFVLGTDGKSTAWLQTIIASNPTPLTIPALFTALSIMETQLGVAPYSGNGLPKDDAPLADMFLAILSSEAYNQFTFDPWVTNYKNCAFDILNNQFRGRIFGRITTKLEPTPLRFDADGAFPQPEIVSAGGAGAVEVGATVPNPEYAEIAQAPYEIAFLGGTIGYESLEVGPPPAEFASNTPPNNFASMNWNGQVRMTKNFPVPCVDADTGAIIYEGNYYGEYLKMFGQVADGVLAVQRRNVVPIIFKRTLGAQPIGAPVV